MIEKTSKHKCTDAFFKWQVTLNATFHAAQQRQRIDTFIKQMQTVPVVTECVWGRLWRSWAVLRHQGQPSGPLACIVCGGTSVCWQMLCLIVCSLYIICNNTADHYTINCCSCCDRSSRFSQSARHSQNHQSDEMQRLSANPVLSFLYNVLLKENTTLRIKCSKDLTHIWYLIMSAGPGVPQMTLHKLHDMNSKFWNTELIY